MQTFVSQITAPFSTVNYLADIFSGNVDVSKLKLVRVVVELFNFVYQE